MTVEHLLLCRQLEGERKVRNKSGEDLSECREGRKGTKKDESGHCGWRRVGKQLRHKKEKNKIKLN